MSDLIFDFGKRANVIQGELPEDFSHFPAKIIEKELNLLIVFTKNGDVKFGNTKFCNDFIAPWIDFSSSEEVIDYINELYSFFSNNGGTPPYDILIARRKNTPNCYAIIIKEISLRETEENNNVGDD